MVAKLANPNKPEILGFDPQKSVSTGCTLLNLACTDLPNVGIPAGGYVYFVGASNSGKTWLGLVLLAEANLNPAFDKYRLIYDAAERGNQIDVARHFGMKLAARIEPPAWSGKGDSRRTFYSTTAESFYFHLDEAKAVGRPFIYILDSESALYPEVAKTKFDERHAVFKKQRAGTAKVSDKKVSGSYGLDKAKLHSESMRMSLAYLEATGSILFVIGQTRQNISGYGRSTVRTGGDALAFYANIRVWTSIKGKLTKIVNGRERVVGNKMRFEVERTRFTGKQNDVLVDFYPSLPGNIDDVGSCVDFLVDEKFWKLVNKDGEPVADGSLIATRGLGKKFIGRKETIIARIESDGLESKLRELCGVCWKELQDAMTIRRKPRYVN